MPEENAVVQVIAGTRAAGIVQVIGPEQRITRIVKGITTDAAV